MNTFKANVLACAFAFVASPLVSQESEDVVELDTFVAEEEIGDDLGILQTDPVDSVFGFGKTILETPRAVSSISSEFLDQFNATGINDIVNFVPGTFTTSFFGVAGSLDIRGTSAENYFRGVKRLNNEGNYPTPIGATDRVDVIRGPMSPISGPSKVGGALNFIPKSARAETGQYMNSPSGAIGYTIGSWSKSVLTAEVGGPTEIAGKSAGYYVYAEVEDSDSYYNNDFNKQTLIQASFNMDLSPSTRIEFGGMYQDWSGHENGGWNRVTQDLVDTGTYTTGLPATAIDGIIPGGIADGLMQEAEIDYWEANVLPGYVTNGDVECFTSIAPFCQSVGGGLLDPSQITDQLLIDMNLGLDPATVGTAILDGSQVLITDRDRYDTSVNTFYFDVFHEMDNGWTVTNKFFYDAQEYINVDSYGFTKIADAWVIEDQLIFANSFEGDGWTLDFQASPSIRHTDAFYALDFGDEVFSRTDLTQGFNSLSIQEVPSLAPTPGQESWSDYWNSSYTQYGFSIMTDSKIGDNLSILLGARYDYVDAESENGDGAGPVQLRTFDPDGEHKASNTDSGVTWTASISYTLPGNITPYITAAEQTTIISGSAGDMSAVNVKNKTFMGDSEMTEFGIKASLLDGRLFMAGNVYEQERVAFNANSPVSNEASISDGYELEFRYVPTDKLALIGTYSSIDVRNITGGAWFSYIDAANLTSVTDPSLAYGGIIGGVIAVADEQPRGGIPDTTWSLSGSYKWTEEFATSVTVTYVEEVEPSILGGIVLPDYTVINLSAVYNSDAYKIGLYVNNVTDEQFFRGNFPSLYGNNAILPERPINWKAEFSYKF